MDSKIISFPTYKVGLRPEDKVAIVTTTENGRAITLKLPEKNSAEISVFAHNDLIDILKVGDRVRFDYTSYGALVIDRLARPGELPLPRVNYSNGCVMINPDDPALRLYNSAKIVEK